MCVCVCVGGRGGTNIYAITNGAEIHEKHIEIMFEKYCSRLLSIRIGFEVYQKKFESLPSI